MSLKHYEKALWHFNIALPQTFFSMAAVMKTAAHVPNMGIWFYKEKSESCYQGIVFVCFDVSQSSLEEWHKVPAFLCLTLRSIRAGKKIGKRCPSKSLKGK